MPEQLLADAHRQIRQLESRVGHQKVLVAQLSKHGFKGAAAEALTLLDTLQRRLGRDRRNAELLRENATLEAI